MGSVIARLLGPVGSNRSILNEIEYDSLNLLDLHEQFVVNMEEGLRVYNFFEKRETCLVQMGSLKWTKFVSVKFVDMPDWRSHCNLQCVKEQSVKYSGPSGRVQNIGLAVDHSGLNKFGSRTTEYGSIRDKILTLLPPEPQDIYSVPAQRVGSYTSRDNLSRLINEELWPPAVEQDSDATSDYRALVIHGMGGVGKTQLALNFVEEHRHQYSPILWIDAHTTETAQLSFERSAAALGLTIDTAAARNERLLDSPAIAGVMRWFSERDEGDRKWLVVVDNADDTTWNVEEIIPRGHQGHAIVTSRHPQSPRFLNSQCARLDVGKMEQQEARALLKQHVGVENELGVTNIDDLCDQVADRLGYLALAVDLAGAYLTEQFEFNDSGVEQMRDVKAVLEEYLADYDRHRDDLLCWEPFYRLSSYDQTVWTVWDTSLAAIKRTSAGNSASQLLTFLAYFDQGIVQEELFRLASIGWPVMTNRLGVSEDEVPDWLRNIILLNGREWNHFHYRQAIQPLIRYGMVQRLGGDWTGTTMHSLVQWRARKENPDIPWPRWARLLLMAAVCQTNRDKGRPEFRRHLVAHLLTTNVTELGAGPGLDLDEELMASLWKELGDIYFHEGRWQEAETLQVRVMETSIRVLGEEHPGTLTSMSNLASTYWNQGRWQEAETLDVRVMETWIRVLGEEHPDTLRSMNNLASTYWNQGRWQEAETLQVRVMETSIRVLGEEHPDTLTSMSNLASTYWNQGRWQEAETLQVRVMETWIRVLGEEHPDTLTSMSNLASTYRNQGRWQEAETLDVRVMETSIRVLGEEHHDTLTSMSNLASTYWNQGRRQEAETLQVRVMETSIRVLGEEHPNTLTSMNNLALTYSNQGRWQEAETLRVRVMETSIRVLGEEHPNALASMNNLAATYWNQGRWQEAETLQVRVMETSIRVLGEEHPNTLTSMNNLASTYSNQGRWQEAETLQVRVMETSIRVLGEEHPNALASMNNLAATYSDQGRWQEAETLQVRVMETSIRVLGEEHHDTLTSMSNLASTYRNRGRWQEAETLEVRVMETRIRVLGEEHPDTLRSMNNLGSTYSDQ